LEGNLDIFSHETLGATVKSSQLISATFRLFLACAINTSEPTVAIQTMHGLSQWAFRIHSKYTVTKGVLINTHLSLAMATIALRFPSRFASNSGQVWLRSTFASCLSCHQAFKIEKTETSPLLYWTCTLWSFLFHVLGNHLQSVNLLKTVIDDMTTYLERCPQSMAVKQILDIALHNMVLSKSDHSTIRYSETRNS
jgi:predicted membrane-bound dolichyl-phosphate-mannose-protein mannosyltransferase